VKRGDTARGERLATVNLRQVVKRFGALEVVHGIDLDIADTEFLVLVGPSGCGKSTLLRMIAGLEDVSSGAILIDGRTVNEVQPKSRDIAMVFQDYALYPHLSVFRNMSFALEVQGKPKDEVRARVERAATILDIAHLFDRLPGQLSGGQRQRVAMGRALVRNPKVFLFDEPLSNLDAKLRSDMRIEIKKLHQEVRTTIIYVTHDQVEAMTLADRIVVMRAGHVEQIGTPDDVYNRPATLFVGGFIGAPRMNQIVCRPAADGCATVETEDGVRFPLSRFRPDTLGSADRKLVLGLRPETFTFANGDGPLSLQASIRFVEPLGSDTLIFFPLGATEIIARLPPSPDLKAGATIRLAADPDKLHLFDGETGRLIAPTR
jgi:multiple sugar transport system ATP-binding protein